MALVVVMDQKVMVMMTVMMMRRRRRTSWILVTVHTVSSNHARKLTTKLGLALDKDSGEENNLPRQEHYKKLLGSHDLLHWLVTPSLLKVETENLLYQEQAHCERHYSGNKERNNARVQSWASTQICLASQTGHKWQQAFNNQTSTGLTRLWMRITATLGRTNYISDAYRVLVPGSILG